MSIIKIDSLEIFKQNRYYPTDIGLVAYNCKYLDCGSLFWWDFTKKIA